MRLMTYNLGLFRLTPLDLSAASLLPVWERRVKALSQLDAETGQGVAARWQRARRSLGKLANWPIMEPAKWIEERLAHMGAFLRDSGADVICLQEIYDISQQNMLIRQLRDIYPHFARSSKAKHFGVSDGLLILARWPLENIQFDSFADGLWIEDLVGRKGMLHADVASPDLGPLRIFNIHVTAGALVKAQDDPDVETIRGKQIAAILDKADLVNNAAPIICGDFNMGPEISRVNYDALAAAGYADLYADAVNQGRATDKPTWAGANGLVNGGPDMRIDLVLMATRKLRQFCVTAADVVGQEDLVSLIDGSKVPLSDHYAVTVDIDPVSA